MLKRIEELQLTNEQVAKRIIKIYEQILNVKCIMCNVLTYEQIDRNEWSKLVVSSSTGTWFQTPEAFDFYVSQPELFKPFADASALERDFGFKLKTSLRDGLRKFAEWYKGYYKC